jgi:hypothetical protein
VSLDDIAALWTQNKSLSEIGAELGISRGVVIGKIDRARKAGDDRFSRQPKVRQIKEPGLSVGNRHPAPIAAPPSPPLPLVRLRPGLCKWPTNAPPPGHANEMLFCGEPVARLGANYCGRHAEMAVRVSPSRPVQLRAS